MNFFLLNSSYFEPLIFDLSESHWAFHLSPISLRITFSSSSHSHFIFLPIFVTPAPLFLKYFYTYLHFMSFFVFVLSLSRILIWMHINFYFTMHSTFTACTSVVPFHTFFLKLNIKVRCSNFKLLSLAYIAVFAHTV